jgi:hypothetical protein
MIGLFIPDPNPDFLPFPDLGSRVKKAPDPDPQHWKRRRKNFFNIVHTKRP